MAGKGARRGHRAAIAASFVVQAAVIAVVATGSAAGPAGGSISPAAPGITEQTLLTPPSAAPAASASASAPASPAISFPPGVIPVVVSATSQPGGSAQPGGPAPSGGTAQPSGTAQSGDIGFPMPEDPPRLVISPGAPAVITVDISIPPGAQVRGLWVGIAAEQWAGPLRTESRLLSVSQPLRPGRHSYTLRWSFPPGTPPGTSKLLVMDVQHPAGADKAPIAELVAG